MAKGPRGAVVKDGMTQMRRPTALPTAPITTTTTTTMMRHPTDESGSRVASHGEVAPPSPSTPLHWRLTWPATCSRVESAPAVRTDQTVRPVVPNTPLGSSSSSMTAVTATPSPARKVTRTIRLEALVAWRGSGHRTQSHGRHGNSEEQHVRTPERRLCTPRRAMLQRVAGMVVISLGATTVPGSSSNSKRRVLHHRRQPIAAKAS